MEGLGWGERGVGRAEERVGCDENADGTVVFVIRFVGQSVVVRSIESRIILARVSSCT